MAAEHWTPDQPLRADATDEQIEGRASYFGDGEPDFHANPTADAAREFAAACVAASRLPVSSGAVTEDMVEAAAKAIWSNYELAISWEDAPAASEVEAKDMARIALTAALTASPASREREGA